MHETEVNHYIKAASNGDDIAREKLINHHKPYIINTVGHVCKRFITWSDEESSLGLLAFDRAIDTYDSCANKSFLNYVYLLIKRELIDYFRRETKLKHIPLEVESINSEDSVTVYDVDHSMDTYHQHLQQRELVEEILELSEILKQFNIEFEELEACSPTHRKTKANLITIANDFIQNPELVDFFLKKKRFPVTRFIEVSGHRLKTVERHRKYIVALVVVRLHPEWRQLSAYIQVTFGNEGKS
ncbi:MULTISPECIES: sigma factor [Paraliobacillus]|uniref:sigma factor n=1 Tax=Paraliobacillus TaxID=200903 RepID=UPI001300AEC4|nr:MULTISPECIES: sigma factor [Paraliobacillus]